MLANQVASIPNLNLVIGISVGVGFFLMVAVLRAVFHWKLGRVLSIAYPIAFIVALFSSDYLAVAIDSAALPRGRSRCPSCWPSSAAARPRPATATPRTTTSASAPFARWAPSYALRRLFVSKKCVLCKSRAACRRLSALTEMGICLLSPQSARRLRAVCAAQTTLRKTAGWPYRIAPRVRWLPYHFYANLPQTLAAWALRASLWG